MHLKKGNSGGCHKSFREGTTRERTGPVVLGTERRAQFSKLSEK